MNRRFFLQLSAMAAASALATWRFTPPSPAFAAAPPADEYEAVVVGAGLGGLCCAAHLARAGFKTLVLEQYDVPGGYATSFTRPSDRGAFTCEVSLHSSALRSPGMSAMLQDLGVWDRLALVDHPHSWSSRFPGFSLDVPGRCGLDGFERQLAGLFPAEKEGLAAYFALWRGVLAETRELGKGLAPADKAKFPEMFKSLWAIHDKTLGQVVDAHIRDPRPKAVLTQSCGYYGLPPSRLAAFFYLQPTGEYLESGGCYVRGTSQALSDALATAVTEAGGEVRCGARVTAILAENQRVTGVRTEDGKTFKARTVICNASAPQVFGSLLSGAELPAGGKARLATYGNSPSSFIVWLGLDRDITGTFTHPEVSYNTGLDMEAKYTAAMACDFENSGFGLMVYDNLIPGFSPKGCTTVTAMSLCGYGPWKEMEADYLAGRAKGYAELKQRLTDQLVAQVEKRAIPGLSKMIIMQDSSTPLTNLRFTLNTAGALYGYDQTVENSFMSRNPNRTEIGGLYLASAWGNPGGGFGGALMGGKAAFREVAGELSKARA